MKMVNISKQIDSLAWNCPGSDFVVNMMTEKYFFFLKTYSLSTLIIMGVESPNTILPLKLQENLIYIHCNI